MLQHMPPIRLMLQVPSLVSYLLFDAAWTVSGLGFMRHADHKGGHLVLTRWSSRTKHWSMQIERPGRKIFRAVSVSSWGHACLQDLSLHDYNLLKPRLLGLSCMDAMPVARNQLLPKAAALKGSQRRQLLATYLAIQSYCCSGHMRKAPGKQQATHSSPAHVKLPSLHHSQ